MIKLVWFGCLVLAFWVPVEGWASDWQASYDSLLQKYVTAEGVKYKDWHGNEGDVDKLAKVITAIGREDLSKAGADDQLAFYLNAYNAWILHRILEDYPTKGPGGGGLFGRNRFFKAKELLVAGKTTSFHLLENEIIRPTFKDPRIHFALNCASSSCPPLHPRAFAGDTLDVTLNALARNFMNDNPKGVKQDGGEVELSKVFDWYAEDFQPDVLAYVNGFRENKIPSKTKVKYQKYFWTLNEVE